MREFLLGRSSLAQAALLSVVSFAAVALLGLVLAYWTWMWLAPRAEPRSEAPAVPSGNAASAGALFGVVPRSENAAAPTGIAIRLLGVAAASGGRLGSAVLQIEGKQIRAVNEDEDIAPGIRLAEVHPDHVILVRSGTRERLAWPHKRAATPGAQTATK